LSGESSGEIQLRDSLPVASGLVSGPEPHHLASSSQVGRCTVQHIILDAGQSLSTLLDIIKMPKVTGFW